MADAHYAAAAALISWLLLVMAASQLAALAYPIFRRFTRTGAAGHRALAQLAYGALGPVGATLSAILIMDPDWAGLLVPEHCHGRNCDPHRPLVGLANPAGLTLLAASVATVLLVVVMVQRTIQRTRRRLSTLHMLADKPAHLDFSVVESASPLAWCAGLLWPRVYVSSGLLSKLSPRELAAVLAHEHAHAERHDNLRQLLLSWMTLAWPGKRRAQLLADYSNSSEQACDEAASRRTGDPHLIIALLERLSPAAGTTAARQPRASAEPDARERVEALRAPVRRPLTLAWAFLAVVWLVGMTLLTGMTHRIIELFTLS